MKLAVLSDIHGNLFALKAVLADIEKQNVDKIFCLGDLAMAGPEPNKTVDFVKSQDWTVIQGNTDKMISNFSEELFEKVSASAPIMANALREDVKDLSEENIQYLYNLPENYSTEIDGVKMLFVHGSPRRNDENIYPNMNIDEIEEIFDGVVADIVFCGHTHMPCGYQTQSKMTVVNDGSVGRPFTDKPDACYVLVEIVNGEFTIEHRMIDYDRISAKEILEKRGFSGAEKLAEMVINPQTRHM